MLRIISMLIIASILSACAGVMTNPPEIQPYLNKSVVLTHDMVLCQIKNWRSGTTTYLSKLGNESCGGYPSNIGVPKTSQEFAQNPEKWRTWQRDGLDFVYIKTLDIIPSGTCFSIEKYTIPIGMSDASPNAWVTFPRGPYQHMDIDFPYFIPEKDMRLAQLSCAQTS